MASPSEVADGIPWKNKMKLYIILWFTLGGVSSTRYPRYLPRGVVHVFFMHHDPHITNTSNEKMPQNFGNVLRHRTPIRTLYRSLMSYLDDSLNSFEEYDTADSSNKSQDPWVHFIEKVNGSDMFDNGIKNDFNSNLDVGNSTIKTNTSHLFDDDSGFIKAGPNNSTNTSIATQTSSNNSVVPSDIYIDSIINRNFSARDTISSNTSEHRIKRIRKDCNSGISRISVDQSVKTNQTQKPLTIDQTKEKKNSNGNLTERKPAVANLSKDLLQDDFTSTVEKMIDLIDSQLENKTQAILKRIKRVTKTDAKKTSNLSNMGSSITGHESKTVKTNLPASSISPEEKVVQSVTEKVNATTVKPVESIKHEIEKGKIISSAEPNPISTPEPTVIHSETLTVPKVLPELNTESSKTDQGTTGPQTNETTLDSKIVLNSTVIPATLEHYNTTGTTERKQEEFDVPNGMTAVKETSNSAEPQTQTMTEDDDEYQTENKQQAALRNMMDPESSMTVSSDLVESSVESDKFLENGDVMTALVIPIFLVVLMGSLLFAIHNMSRYFDQRNRNNERRQSRTTANPNVPVVPANVVQISLTSRTNETPSSPMIPAQTEETPAEQICPTNA